MILSFLQKPFLYLLFLILYLSIGSTHSQDTVRKIQEGESFLKDRNYTAAYQSFSEASRLNPMSIRSLLGFAEAAQHLHKDKESLDAYNKVLELEPEKQSCNQRSRLRIHSKKRIS
ncbi:tetratricopeptide repeat protein [Leptospira interrogans serovar Pyrogenes str. 200701872]|uniref:Tetratricopeptide repeat protein n=1 Tax=Leptospira interrogans serovar Pyrogenes str. 200701872 TaxID=1193029 RepID=M6ZS94_LEPIR|nr:tetratricopeptide repeat protein [Leptospira interrogans serovar Pyrogenes str. 200701872]